MKTSDLSGVELDYWVALALSHQPRWCSVTEPPFVEIVDWNRPGTRVNSQRFMPSTDWAQGGPLIEQEKLECEFHFGQWLCEPQGGAGDGQLGPTMLVAAMRCLVARKFGEEVNENSGD